MTDKATLEAVQRAISAKAWAWLIEIGTVGPGRQEPDDYWFQFNAHAQAAVTAYEATQSDTHVMVLREPTEAMLHDGGEHFAKCSVDVANKRINRLAAKNIYQAMIAAHEDKDIA